MADSKAITQSARVATDEKSSVVVVSATSGTTNRLHELVKAVSTNNTHGIETLVGEIVSQHQQAADELQADESVKMELERLFSELRTSIAISQEESSSKQFSDSIVSFGERLSSPLMVAALRKQNQKAELIDARQLIKTDHHFGRANPIIEQIADATQESLVPNLSADSIVVTQGYIGSSPDGSTTTLGRGGSDYTATLLGEALLANQVQIWTDVNGIASTDPRLSDQACRIEQLSFQEAAELATAGAKILYPKAITPSRRANIPLFIGNTFAPNEGGTTISAKTEYQPLMRAIAIKTNQTLMTITTPEMAHDFGYLARIFNVFAGLKISIDQISTSEISVAVAIENQMLIDHNLIEQLEEFSTVRLEKGLSVISLIGNRINATPGLVQDIFAKVENSKEKIAIRMICQGASTHNLCFLVADEHGTPVVRRLHKAFIEEGDGVTS